jgi:hypothetical protein
MAASLMNYLIFFLPGLVNSWRSQRTDALRLAKFRRAEEVTVHCCGHCGRTEVSHPELDFRVAADGEEYCTEHLPGK